MIRTLTLSLLVLLVGGCASAEGAYADGMEFETDGDYVSAAGAYATALERDPSIRNVPGRLAVAGREAIRYYIAQAQVADAEGAARFYLAADELAARSARLGVEVERPATFDADRDDALDRGVIALLGHAEAHRRRGGFADALAALSLARTFRPTEAQATQLDALALRTYADWAEADLDAGRYRDALAHADAALDLDPAATEVNDLRATILDVGTVVAAILPSEGPEEDASFLRDLDDVLVEDGLTPTPILIALIDPADVRRWERRQRGQRRPALSDSPRRLGDAADDLGADLGVVVAMRPIAVESVEGDARTESVNRRGGGSATISTRAIRLTLTGRADVTAAEAGSGRTVCERSADARATESYDRATTVGDWQALDLSRRQRAAFDADAGDRAEDRARADLRDRLATALAREIATCLERQVR